MRKSTQLAQGAPSNADPSVKLNEGEDRSRARSSPGCVGKGAPLAVFFRPLTEVVTVTEFVTYTIDEGCRMKERFWEKWSNQFV